MISKFSFTVTFASTGKTIKGEHNFQKGLSAITGPNEQGKSLRLELIRYALFGTAALRAPISSYTTLATELQFAVKEKTYTVRRNLSSARLLNDKNQPIATGTKSVNEAILEILGYGMDVFDVANACLQGRVEELSDKTPMERRRMVDKTIGLEGLDTVIAEVSTKLSGLRQTQEHLEKLCINEPVEPELPGVLLGWSEETLSAKLSDMYDKNATIDGLITRLQSAAVQKPEEPTITITQTLPELTELANRRSSLQADVAKMEGLLDRLAANPVDEDRLALLNQYIDGGYAKKWSEFNVYAEKAGNVLEPELKDMDALLALRHYFDVVAPNKIRVDMLNKHSVLTCPLCKGTYSTDQEELDRRTEQFNRDYNPIVEPLLKTIWTAHDAEIRIKLLEDWLAFKALPVVSQPDLPFLGSEIEVTLERDRLVKLKQEWTNVGQLQASLDDLRNMLLVIPADIQQRIQTRAAEEQAVALYKEKLERWDRFITLKGEIHPQLDALGAKYTPEEIEGVKDLIRTHSRYKQELHDYNVHREIYNNSRASIEEIKTQIENHTRARKALNELKPLVKTYLVPSLNKVASNLLSQMTNGQRNLVEVDENFEIKIDGQPINTLSGSGKAVANLAIRIALGTVLTNRVFSVFLADEVDASMDPDRAAHTAECMRNLTKVVSQVILVSHKKPEADHQIEL